MSHGLRQDSSHDGQDSLHEKTIAAVFQTSKTSNLLAIKETAVEPPLRVKDNRITKRFYNRKALYLAADRHYRMSAGKDLSYYGPRKIGLGTCFSTLPHTVPSQLAIDSFQTKNAPAFRKTAMLYSHNK